jgi:hypothetical protein
MGYVKVAIVVSAAVFLLWAGLAAGQQSDKAAGEMGAQTAEIKRGAKAAMDCYMEYPPDLIVKEKTDCIEGIRSEAEAKKAATPPYLGGLNFQSWLLLSRDLKSFEPMYRMMERYTELDIIRKRVDGYFTGFKRFERESGMDDKVLCALLNLNYEATAKEIQAWTARGLGKP